MKTNTNIEKLWTCPKCGRQFKRKNQMHSCKLFALELHFKEKPIGELLYEKLKEALLAQIGVFKIESLECCIHFVNKSTFMAVKIAKDKIRLDFSLNRIIENKRIIKFSKMSANRYLYCIDIKKGVEIDKELLIWIEEAFHLSD